MDSPENLTGSALKGGLDIAAKTLQGVSRALQSHIVLPGLGKHRRATLQPGASPGIEHMPEVHQAPPRGAVAIRVVEYGPERVESREVLDLEAFLAEPRPSWCAVRWIGVSGLHAWTVARLRDAFGLHSLAAEDVLNIPQRPKVEPYDAYLFLVTRMLQVREGRLVSEQVSAFFWPDTILSFNETSDDVWKPIRTRIEKPDSRLRANGASYLLYALLDVTTDTCFPILEHFGDLLQAMEDDVVERPSAQIQQRIHEVKRDLIMMRRVMWPMRQVADDLVRGEHSGITPSTRTYLRDVVDHSMQVLDILETYREIAGGLTELYMSSISQRMNEIMKVLTIMASLFIPITFLAGVYGMNFGHIPELDWPWAYYIFWAVCFAAVGAMLVFFRRRGWIGGG